MAVPPSPRLPGGISAVFPAYNDAATIPSMVLTAILALRQVTDDYEVIVTNDGSSDQTGPVLDELAQRIPELHVIHHPQNRGYGMALRSGFAAARKDWIFYTDGDAQYDPMELITLVENLKDGVDVVNGYKISRGDSLLRVIVGRLYHHTVRLAFGFKLRDVDCDFRLIRRELFKRIPLKSETGAICLEMVKKFQDAGAVFVEVPVHHYPRPHGASQFFHPRHIFNTLCTLAGLWQELVLKK
ncbi:MAG TPA: glycosyltransferase family 2 protein [Anaerolineaceae bacterium]|nr:glycosyltransferase family 2 protein [Anaerolineaceae bacterium]HPN50964.1 glycosyltransferase family 2 protein [Anaerolineaceae bacterium]